MKEKIVIQAEQFVREGKLDKAIKEYEKILAIDASELRIKLKIADLYARKKDVKKSVRYYRDVAEAYIEQRFPLKAIAVLKTILKLNLTSIDINEKLGDLYCEVGLDSEAVSQYYIVAGYYDNKRMSQEAMRIRQKIVEIDPTNTTGRVRLAELFQAEGKAEESYHEYEKVAEILKAKKDRDGIIEIYEKMIHYRPDNKDMLMELCRAYFAKKDFKKVLKRIEQATAALKSDLDIIFTWCEALLEDRQLDAARKKFRILFSTALENKKMELAAMVKSRILQEFSDDEDYLKEIEQMARQANVSTPDVEPKFREDFEKTEMIDFESSFNPPKKK